MGDFLIIPCLNCIKITQKQAWRPLIYFAWMKSMYFREYVCRFSRKLHYFCILCVSHLKQIYVYIYVYICIIYHYALRNAKIELNERPSFTPSSWHSINTQFTDHVTAFRRRCLLIIRCLSISWLHACSVAKRTGLAGYPPGATLGVDPGLHHRCAHTGGWLATKRQILADSEVKRGNGLTIVTEGTQLPISFWRFH